MTSKRRTLLCVGVGLVVAVAGGQVGLAQSDPMVGTWTLNIARSVFSAGSAPKKQTRTWNEDGTVRVSSVNAAGETVTYGYTIKADGKMYPATGAVPGGADAVRSRRVDARTIKAEFSRNGKLADTDTFTVSADGRQLTLTAHGIQPGGKPLNDRLIYERQR